MVSRVAPGAAAPRGEGGAPAGAPGSPAKPLPWLAEPVAAVLASQRGHATLLHAAPGDGALDFALALAQSLLCERPQPSGLACGACGSCKLVQARLHPDLVVLMPEALRRSTGWLLNGDKIESEEGKRKPSRQIRIDEVRGLIDWSHTTTARHRGKVAVLHPADALNLTAASALLKTLEEPAPGTRLLLTTADPEWLLPTVRSRCQRVRLPPPSAAVAQAWLAGQGVQQPEVLLAACNGHPLDALALAQAGVTAAGWSALPRAVAQGQAAALAGWPVPQMLDALQKLCHDAMALAVGGAPAYFPAEGLPAVATLAPLVAWQRELTRVTRHADHPWNDGLLLDALAAQGQQALSAAAPVPRRTAVPAEQGAGTVARHGQRGQGFATLPR